jgi:hypothetical protein
MLFKTYLTDLIKGVTFGNHEHKIMLLLLLVIARHELGRFVNVNRCALL